MREWTCEVKKPASKSLNSPFDGRAFKGAATIVSGRAVWKS